MNTINNILYENASFKDFENVPGLNIFEKAAELSNFLSYMKANGRHELPAHRTGVHQRYSTPRRCVTKAAKGVYKLCEQ